MNSIGEWDEYMEKQFGWSSNIVVTDTNEKDIKKKCDDMEKNIEELKKQNLQGSYSILLKLEASLRRCEKALDIFTKYKIELEQKVELENVQRQAKAKLREKYEKLNEERKKTVTK